MNAELLLAHYERIAEAPDAITRLRRFILDLAVRGKLVEQDPSDEPASELLKRIAAEKARLAKAGEIRKPKPLGPVDDPAFFLPDSWAWVRIREITSDRGQQIPNAPFTYIDVTAINKEAGVVAAPKVFTPADAPSRARKVTQKGDVIYSCVRPYLLNVAVIEQDFDPDPIASTAFAILNGHGLVLPRYIWIVLRTPFMIECVEATQRGQAYPAINDADFAVLPFPLPPLAEQHRIVAKVDELMALCDQLEAARAEREAGRDKLTMSTLAKLNEADPETLADDARFALEQLEPLTKRTDQIKQLKQTILNLAVRGKLVAQDPNDEPVSELLGAVEAARRALPGTGKAKGDKRPILLTHESPPFSIPSSWQWVRMEALCELITKGSSPKWQGINYVDAQTGLLFITSENVGNGRLRKLDELKYVERRFADVEPRSMLRKGDLLMNLVGASIGRTAVYDLDAEANINQAVAILRLIQMEKGPYLPFLRDYLNSPDAITIMLGSRVVTAQPNISLTDARNFPLPLPPLAEQHRIVAKVQELMALCDQLEASLVEGAQTRSQLLEAVLHEALEPA